MSEHDGSEIDELGVTLGSQKDAQLKQSPYMASVSALDADASATADAAADAPAEDAVVCPPATASATPSDPRPLASSATPPPPPAAADAAAAETASEAAESAAGFAAAGGSGAFSAVPRPPSSAAAGQGEASAGLPAPASVPVSAVPSGVLSELPPPSRGLEEEAFDAPEAAAAAASRVLEEEAGGEAAACRSQVVEEEEAEQPPPPPVASEGAPSRASSRRASCVAEDDASTQGSFRGDAVSAGVGSRRASHASEIASYHYNCDESESHQTDCIISERKQRSAQSASQQAPSQQVASSLPFPDDIPSPAIPAPYAASSQPRPSPTPTPQDVRSSPAVQPLSAQSSKRLPTGYDSQPQPPANSVHEGLVSAMAAPSQRQPPPAALRRVSSPYTDAGASAGRRSATPPQHRPAAARSAADSPVAAAASPSPVQPPPPSQYQQQQQQQQPSPAAAARRADPVFDAACALWDAREQRLREARAAKEAQQRRAESEHGRKLRMMDEVRHLQQNERRTQFHARERYPAQRFDTTVASPQRQTKVASLDTTASYSMYKDVYGVVPHSADVYRETVGSSSSPAPAGRDGASPSPQRRSRSREPSQPGAAQSPPHGMSTLQHTRSILERSRLQPDSENSLDAIARLKRLKKISSASSTLLTSCPRSPQTPGRAGGRVPAGSPTGLRCLNPRHPEWRIAQDGTFLLPDGTPANVLDHLRGFRR